MRTIFRNIRLVAAACLLAACSPARTGVIGNTLTTNVKPHISITGLPPLTVAAHGKRLVMTPTDKATTNEDVSFDYALFAEPTPTGLNRLAYAAIVRLTHPGMWVFQPSVTAREAFSAQSATLDGIYWDIQTLRISPEGDWASDMWRANNRPVPTFWLVRRWVAPLDGTVKAVMEYREPWPELLPQPVPGLAIGGGPGGEALQAFIRRADATFRVEKKGGSFPKQTTTPTAGSSRPQTMPDIPSLAGEVISIPGS